MSIIVAIGSTLAAVATVALAIIAWHQLLQLRRQVKELNSNGRKWATLEACNRFDSDPILVESTRKLRAKTDIWRLRVTDPHSNRNDVVTVLNYFDSIAIGCAQGLYNEKLVKDHLENIIRGVTRSLLHSGPSNGWDFDEGTYPSLVGLIAKWDEDARRTNFSENQPVA